MTTAKYNVVIIGAGLTGLLLAKKLTQLSVAVLEKSKGIGGRLATRRVAGIAIDHGARELDMADPLFSLLPTQRQDESINQWVKSWSADIVILRETLAHHWLWDSGHYHIYDRNNVALITTEKIIVTAPAPQAMALLDNSMLDSQFLSAVNYSSEVQFFCVSKHPFATDLLVDWLELYSSRQDASGVYVHFYVVKSAKTPWALEQDKESLKRLWLSQIPSRVEVLDAHVHIWRYSQVTHGINNHWQTFYQHKGIYLAGDYFGEGGLRSSLNSAANLLALPEFASS